MIVLCAKQSQPSCKVNFYKIFSDLVGVQDGGVSRQGFLVSSGCSGINSVHQASEFSTLNILNSFLISNISIDKAYICKKSLWISWLGRYLSIPWDAEVGEF